MASIEESDDIIADINVTPFVDIVLVLLIILMVTSTHIVRASMKVDLPKAATAGEAVVSTLNIIVEASGQILIDGSKAGMEQLAERVRAERAKSAEVHAVIAADRAVDYGVVVHVIDVVRQNGVSQFALNVEREIADVR